MAFLRSHESRLVGLTYARISTLLLCHRWRSCASQDSSSLAWTTFPFQPLTARARSCSPVSPFVVPHSLPVQNYINLEEV